MDAQKESSLRRVFRLAYEKPTKSGSKNQHTLDVSGLLFDLTVVLVAVAAALWYFLGA